MGLLSGPLDLQTKMYFEWAVSLNSSGSGAPQKVSCGAWSPCQPSDPQELKVIDMNV